MKKSRRIKLEKSYSPLPSSEGDEIFRNGIFHFNISRIMEYIESGMLKVEIEQISINEWMKTHYRGSINEDHLPSVDINKVILQAEIRPGMFTIIDGNHRIEKALREGVPSIHSYKIYGEQLIPFFRTTEGYNAFVEYWNLKL